MTDDHHPLTDPVDRPEADAAPEALADGAADPGAGPAAEKPADPLTGADGASVTDALSDPLTDPLPGRADATGEVPSAEAAVEALPTEQQTEQQAQQQAEQPADRPADQQVAAAVPGDDEREVEKTAERKPVTAELPPPSAYVKLHLQGNVLLSMITPKVQIDGYPAPSKYGENLYPVAPGAHLVSAHAQWIWQYGKAQQEVTLAPGETADVWYATPVLTFLPGAIGLTKQKHPGMMILLLLCGVALAFAVGIGVLAAGT